MTNGREVMEQNMIGWVEIPVVDMPRAKKFYEEVFEIEIQLHNIDGVEMGWFPWEAEKPGSGGMLIRHPEFYIPDFRKGTLVYFNCDDVQIELERAKKLGARILKTKTLISETTGYMGLLHDSEGNRIALHSRK